MTNCAPVAVAIAVADELNSHASTFSLPFTARMSYADFTEDLTGLEEMSEPLVDVVPYPRPDYQIIDRGDVEHNPQVTIGIRKKFKSPARTAYDKSIEPAEVHPYVNLLYEFAAFFMGTTSHRWGGTLETETTAEIDGKPQIVRLFNPDHLRTLGQYTGLLRLRFKMPAAMA